MTANQDVKIKDLTASEVLEQVYERLKAREGVEEVELPGSGVSVEIADDSDWHRNRTGYMTYERVLLLPLGDRTWVIGLGRKTGSYPGREFTSDIITVLLQIRSEGTEDNTQRAAELIAPCEYFRSSMVVALASGQFGWSKRFSSSVNMYETVKPHLERLQAQSIMRDPTVLSLDDLRSVVTLPAKYKPELVPLLVDSLIAVLETVSPEQGEDK